MNKQTLIAIFGALAVVCVTALGVAFIVTNNSDGAPVPAVTSQAPAPMPTPVETSDPLLDILEQTWNEQSSNDQEQLCWLFNVAPDEAWDSFNSGSEGLLPKDTFDEFFEEKC
jgi:hypothetical protein